MKTERHTNETHTVVIKFSLVVMPTGKALPTARVWFAVWRQLLRRWLDDGSKLLLLAANLLHVLWRQCFRLSREAALLSGCTARDWHHHETQGRVWSIQVGGAKDWSLATVWFGLAGREGSGGCLSPFCRKSGRWVIYVIFAPPDLVKLLTDWLTDFFLIINTYLIAWKFFFFFER